jgi:hypothetical protein
MSMPIIPPFAIAASYQNSQYGSGSIYTPGVPSVFNQLVSPPTSGVAAETWSTDQAEADGFVDYSATDESLLITLTGTPTGGTFLLLFGDDTTTPLAYNATASTVQTALTALASIGGGVGGTNEVQVVTLTGATAGTFTLTYSGQTTGAIAYNASAAAVQTALQALSNIGAGTSGTYATQELTINGAATGGTFTLSFGGQTTSGIAYNAAASAVQSALQALSSIGSGNATVEAGQAGGPYNITFAGTLVGPRSLITASAAGLTGGAGANSEILVTNLATGTAGTPNLTVTGSAGGPYTVNFGGTLADTNVAQMTATSSLTGSSPTVVVTTSTGGVANTPNLTVTGSAGGPYTVAFAGQLADEYLAGFKGDGSALVPSTAGVTVTVTTEGSAAFLNQALLNVKQQYDPLVAFYDNASNGSY